MSDKHYRESSEEKEESPKRQSASRSRSKSPSHSRSSAHSSKSKSNSRSRSRSYSRSRSHSPAKKPRSHNRSSGKRYKSYSRSRSPSPYHGRKRGRDTSRSPLSNRKRHVGDREDPEPSRCLGVFGLSLHTTERDVRPLFEKYGTVEAIQIVYDHQTGRSRGFGFVYFEDVNDAEIAKERTSGVELDGRRIRVDFSVTKRAHTPTPGLYMGKASQHRDNSRRKKFDDYDDRQDYDRRDSYRSRDRDYYRDDRRDYDYRGYRSRSRSYSPRRY